MGEYVDIFHNYGIKVMVIHHNFECEFQMDNRRPSTLFGITDIFVRRSERLSYINADYNIFLSQDDIALFHQNYPKKQYSNEYAIGIFKPEKELPSNFIYGPLNYRKFCICGSLNSVQTQIGLKDFEKRYFQLLESVMNDDYCLKIAGRNPSKHLIAWGNNNKNIYLMPNPLNMFQAVHDCGIFICPTNVGGGIKLRILDGLSLGMPILTHEVSARGYNVLHKYRWFQIYRDEKSFIMGLETIIREIKENKHLRQEILEAYASHFSLEHGDLAFRNATKLFLSSDY